MIEKFSIKFMHISRIFNFSSLIFYEKFSSHSVSWGETIPGTVSR